MLPSLLISSSLYGSHMVEQYSRCGRKNVLKALALVFLEQDEMFLLRKPGLRFAESQTLMMCLTQVACRLYSKVGVVGCFLKDGVSKVVVKLECGIRMAKHFVALNYICHCCSQLRSKSRSCWS